jgi:hypothetical protein
MQIVIQTDSFQTLKRTRNTFLNVEFSEAREHDVKEIF